MRIQRVVSCRLVLLLALLLGGLVMGGCATRFSHRPPEDSLVAPLGTHDVASSFLMREFGAEFAATEALLEQGAEEQGELAEFIRKDARIELSSARKAAEEGNISWALEHVWRAYPSGYALTRGFLSLENATRERAAAETPRRLYAALDAMDANISRARNASLTRSGFDALTLAELSIADGRAILDWGFVPVFDGSQWNGKGMWEERISPLSPENSYASRGENLGRVDRRIFTAGFWLKEAQSLSENASDVTLFRWDETRDEMARSEIERIRAKVGYPKTDVSDPWFYSLATSIYPRVVNISVERGWTEAALEAAFRQEAAWDAVLHMEGSASNPNATLRAMWEASTIQPDAVVRAAWAAATSEPLTATESAEAAFAGYILTVSEASHEKRNRQSSEALVLAAAKHRATRAIIMGSSCHSGDAEAKPSHDGLRAAEGSGPIASLVLNGTAHQWLGHPLANASSMAVYGAPVVQTLVLQGPEGLEVGAANVTFTSMTDHYYMFWHVVPDRPGAWRLVDAKDGSELARFAVEADEVGGSGDGRDACLP